MASTPSYVDPGQARTAGPRILVIRLSWKQRYNVKAPGGIPAAQRHPRGGSGPSSRPQVDPGEPAHLAHPALGEPVSRLRRGEPLLGGGPEHGEGGVVDALGPRPGPLEREPVQLVGDLDDPAGVDAVVRAVEDLAGRQQPRDVRRGQLVVRAAADHTGPKGPRDLRGE